MIARFVFRISARGFLIVLLAPLVSSVTGCPRPPACEDCVAFSDPALEDAVRIAIAKPTGDLRTSDLADLVRLDAAQLGIESLEGLQSCTSLAELDLHGNCIADLGPLSGLTSLVSLNLHDNRIVDLEPLTGLTALERLWLGRNLVEDPAPLLANTGLAGNDVTGERDRISLHLNPLGEHAGATVAALESRGAFVTQGLAPATTTKGSTCDPVDAPGDPIPIAISLIHGDPDIPDQYAYVIVLFGEAFTPALLGDPRETLGEYAGNSIAFSNAAADSMGFLLGEEPFAEYAEYLKIYRVDFVSSNPLPTDLRVDPPVERHTALRMGRESTGFAYDQAFFERLANNTGIQWDKLSALVNGDGSGEESGGTVVFSNVTASRRMTALHEFGHGIGNLGDEYEYRHGTDPPQSLPPAVVDDEPNVIATGDRIPEFDEIPWKHWLADSACDSPLLGELVNFGCEQTVSPDCQCDPAPETPETCVPLPACEPLGDFIGANGEYFGRTEWPEPGEAASIVGLYEGAKYRHKGAFRPELRCRMRSIDDAADRDLLTKRFCTVCREALLEAIVAGAGHIASAQPATQTTVPYSRGGEDIVFSIELHALASPGHSLDVAGWSIDGIDQGSGGEVQFILDPNMLPPGTSHEVSVTVHDPTPWVHPDNVDGQSAITQSFAWSLEETK